MNTILIIEDTKSTIDLVNTTLADAGYKVSIATNGALGLKIANKLLPDLILLDILMPEMNGYEVCTALKANALTKNIPVVFMSALTKTFDKVKAFEVGGVDYISKPIDIDEMLARINTHLTIRKLQHELQTLNEELDEKVRIRTTEMEETNNRLTETIEELYNKSAALIRSEERFRYITESITDYIYKVQIYNNDSISIVHSSSCIGVLGYTQEELNNNIGLWQDIIFADDRGRYKEFIDSFMKEAQSCTIEHRITTKNGKLKWVSNTILPFVNDTGELFEYNGIIKDISERKKLEQEILNSVIETEEKERVRFAQEIHDGIGPILSAAKMYALWIAESNNQEEIPKLLAKTTSLIEDANKASREISQKLSPHILQSFGLVSAINNFIESTKIASRLKIEFTNDFDLRFDLQKETILYRVITESINNTLKHANATEIKISISKKNDKLLILYSDNGAGFDIETVMQNRTGLGLFNMKNRIEALNGSYSIESKKSVGTQIKIQIQI